jgi:hypothetical protein
MDPDMVRQQAEAEREALALPRKKPAAPAPASAAAIPHAMPAAAVQDATAAAHEDAALPVYAADILIGTASRAEARLPAEAAPEEPAALSPELQALEPPAEAGPRRKVASMAAQFGRFLSFGLAGAMLGGGLGILAANYMQLPPDLAKLVIFGPAAFFAGACAIASLFTRTSHE